MVPEHAEGFPRLWGSSTDLAVANFAISGQPMPRAFLRTLALVKQAAAETNADLGLLAASVASAISRAAQEVMDGRHWPQFPVDVYQTGSGTSTNMNCNEMIASLATAYLPAGSARQVHPNDDVNRCQSSNDVIPTTMQLSAAIALQETLLPALERLHETLEAKAREFWPVVKVARTHLQDAAPIRLGQEFHGYAGQVEESCRRLRVAMAELLHVPLGGTAAGTGINAHPEFAARTCARLSTRTGLKVQEARNHFHGPSTLDVVITAHGLIKAAALAVWKVASDIRLLASGPRAGLGELIVPDAGVTSSIMPGKSPPAVLESAHMVVARVVGNDATIGFAQTGSLLELNLMMPVATVSMLESIELLAATADNVATRCVVGIVATRQGPRNLRRCVMLVTALSPLVGYDEAARIAQKVLETDLTVHDVAVEHGFTAEQLATLLDPGTLTGAPDLPPDCSWP